MDPAAPRLLFRAARWRRRLELAVGPWLALAGVAMVLYIAIKALPLLGQLPGFLSLGWVAWFAAALVALTLVPFLALYLRWCVRIVLGSWRDALSDGTVTMEGSVTLATCQRYSYKGGSRLVAELGVDGHKFTGFPPRVIKRVRVGDRVRVVHTPRVEYVVEIVRLERPR
jgi:hypothetical protein